MQQAHEWWTAAGYWRCKAIHFHLLTSRAASGIILPRKAMIETSKPSTLVQRT